jgi:hypothetical protein
MARRLPAVLTREGVRQGIGFLKGRCRLVVKLLYGCGLRLSECLQLRVKDIDFAQHQIDVRDGKGGKDRVVGTPAPRFARRDAFRLPESKTFPAGLTDDYSGNRAFISDTRPNRLTKKEFFPGDALHSQCVHVVVDLLDCRPNLQGFVGQSNPVGALVVRVTLPGDIPFCLQRSKGAGYGRLADIKLFDQLLLPHLLALRE